MRRIAPFFLGFVVLAAGCAGGGPRSDLAATADHVGKIRSGTLALSFVVTPRTKLARHPFGFKLHGPFAFGDQPTAKVDYTQIANGHEQTATLVLTDTGGYALVNGEKRQFGQAQLKQVRSAAAAAHGSGTLVDISKWVETAHRCGDGCIEGNLNVPAAIDTFMKYAGNGGTLNDADRQRLADASTATYRALFTKDHLLRDLHVDAKLGLHAGAQLKRALGEVVGADVAVRLQIEQPKT